MYQGVYKSFPVQSDGHLLTVLRYVESNALRAGLVRRAQRWPWSSLTGREEVQQMLSAWPVERPEDWLEMVNHVPDKEVEEVRRSVVKGMPLGSEIWQKKAAARLGLESTFRQRGRPKKEKGQQSRSKV